VSLADAWVSYSKYNVMSELVKNVQERIGQEKLLRERKHANWRRIRNTRTIIQNIRKENK